MIPEQCDENLKTDQKGRSGKGESVQHLDAVQPCLCTTVALGLAFLLLVSMLPIFIGKAFRSLAIPRKIHNSTGRTILHARTPTGIVTIGILRSRYSPRNRIKNAIYKDGIFIDVREHNFVNVISSSMIVPKFLSNVSTCSWLLQRCISPTILQNEQHILLGQAKRGRFFASQYVYTPSHITGAAATVIAEKKCSIKGVFVFMIRACWSCLFKTIWICHN